LAHQDRLNIAVFIDFDNIEIGVKSTLGQQFDVGTILDAIKERGEVVTKIAYADWTRAGEYSRTLTQHAIRLVQRNLTPGGDKNGADINLALDALEMAFTHPHINAYVIVGGDSDFLSLVEKLKQYDKKVFVVGGRAFTSMILQRNCHEFIAYENLSGVRKAAVRAGRPAAATASTPFAQAFPVVRRALKILADREVSPQTGLLKSTLLQLDSTFSERNYGASSFLDFVEKLAQSGMVTLKHSGRSVMVELNEGFHDDEAALKPRALSEGEEASVVGAQVAAAGPAERPAEGRSEGRPLHVAPEGRPLHFAAEGRHLHVAPEGRPVQDIVVATESQETGVQRAGSILTAATGARWPMYLRNVKQILRAADGGFDERRYGFGGLMDLLKACQRAGFVRIERDRRGGLRVFQGLALVGTGGGTAARPMHVTLPQPDVENEIIDVAPIEMQVGERIDTDDGQESALTSREPIPIDTTAELLGRAKPRKPRVRAARPAAAALAPRSRTAAKKPAARRSTRARKPASSS
jgi:uncharacterized LabA/DUF88 family protein